MHSAQVLGHVVLPGEHAVANETGVQLPVGVVHGQVAPEHRDVLVHLAAVLTPEQAGPVHLGVA